jgi:hypothetical protein
MRQSLSQTVNFTSAMLARMDALPDGLTFDPEIRGWDNIRAWYRGEFAGAVHSSRDHAGCWWASVHMGAATVNLGLFNCRDDGKRAIIEWFAINCPR